VTDLFEIEKSTRLVDVEVRDAILAEPGFGKYFTDHMVRILWTEERGWHDAQVVPYAPITIDPATNFVHYGQAIFEGMKAYLLSDGSISTFRPQRNAARFRASARRLAMPELPDELFLGSLEALISVDGEWVSGLPDRSLYLRPFMFSTEVGLGVRPANSYTYILIASPAGPYFPQGVKPVSVWLSDDYVRAAPGGTGEAKCAGNYAASLVAQAEATERGCDQVVWLDAAEHFWIEEMGGMNLFFVFGSGDDVRLVTPELSGALLPGVTRDSLLTLGAELGYTVEERKISIDEWQAGCASGELTEVFACGTAAVITPVGHVKSHAKDWDIGAGEPGPVTMKLRQLLTGIYHGEVADERDWMYPLA